MADIFDELSKLHLNTKEATQESEIIKVNPYYSPELTRIHGVQTGIIMDQYIPILGQFEDIGLIDPGACGVNTLQDAFAVSEKQWTPKIISHRIPMCVDDLPLKLKFWMEAKKAANRWEEISNPLVDYVLEKVSEAVTRAIIRIANFGDTAAKLVSSGGKITTGMTAALFTMLDGLWKQIFTDDAGDQLIPRVEIAENAAGSKAEQENLDADSAYNIMASMVEKLPAEAMSGKNGFQITKSIWDNWVRFLEAKSGAYKPEIMQDGMTKETFRGFPIIVRYDWDRLIKKYHNLGDTYYLPHRAILTDINNIPVGTSDTESFNSFRTWFEQKDKKLYTDVAWREDCKLLLEDSITVAY